MDYTENSHTYLDNGEKSQSYSESTDNNNNQFGLYSTGQEGNLLFDTEGMPIGEASNDCQQKIPGEEVAVEEVP
jgi:hypothetical protein